MSPNTTVNLKTSVLNKSKIKRQRILPTAIDPVEMTHLKNGTIPKVSQRSVSDEMKTATPVKLINGKLFNAFFFKQQSIVNVNSIHFFHQ